MSRTSSRAFPPGWVGNSGAEGIHAHGAPRDARSAKRELFVAAFGDFVRLASEVNAIAVIAQYAAHAAARHVSVHTGLPGVDFGGVQRVGRLDHYLRPLLHLLGPGLHPRVAVLAHEPEHAGQKFYAVFV